MMSCLQKYKRKELLIDQSIPSALAQTLTEHTSAGSQRTKFGFVVFKNVKSDPSALPVDVFYSSGPPCGVAPAIEEVI